MTEHCNKLEPAQLERISLLIEECAEVQHVACKILRHGMESKCPKTLQTNIELIEKELGCLLFAMNLVVYNNDVVAFNIVENAKAKSNSITQTLHYNHEIPKSFYF